MTTALKNLLALMIVLGLAMAASAVSRPEAIPEDISAEGLLSGAAAVPEHFEEEAVKEEPEQEAVEISVADTPARLDINEIGNAEKGLEVFIGKLRAQEASGSGRLTIYHLGDSHVYGKSFSGPVAHGLQASFGDSGGSYFYHPLKKAKKASVKTRGKKASGKKRRGRSKAAPRVKQAKPVKRPAARTAALARLDTRPISEAASETGITYYSYGIIGKTFGYFNSYPLIWEHLSLYRPDLVIITLGTNEAFSPKFDREVFALDVEALASKIKALKPDAAILFTIPPDSYWRDGRENENIAVVRDVLIQFCKSRGHAYWDLYEIMGGKASMRHWLKSGLAGRDKVHFMRPGYELLGGLLSDALVDSYEQQNGLFQTPSATPAQN